MPRSTANWAQAELILPVPPMMTVLPTCQIESTSPFSTFGVKFAGLADQSCFISAARKGVRVELGFHDFAPAH